MKDELEQTDIKILRELLKDGRRSFNSIAKTCDTSSDVIWAHYKKLKKTGIIVGETIQFNYQKFGYSGVAMIMVSVESANLDKVFNGICKFPNVRVFRVYNSIYNIAAITMLKKLSELELVKQGINKQNEISEFKTYLWLDCRNTPENILKADYETRDEDDYLQADQKTPVIDEIDTKIVDALTLNGRVAFREIAKQIGASTTTIARRYENLKKNNFIKVSIQVNPSKLGFQGILDVNLAVKEQNEIDQTANRLCEIPGVSYLVKVSGNFDLSIAALVKDCKGIIDVNEQIVKIPNIRKMEATLRSVPVAWPGPRQYISTF